MTNLYGSKTPTFVYVPGGTVTFTVPQGTSCGTVTLVVQDSVWLVLGS